MDEEIKVVELREVYSYLMLCQNIAVKGIITTILSSGMTRSNVENLKIIDLLLACNTISEKQYALFSGDLSKEEEGVFKNFLNMLLKRKPDNIIPCWVNETEHSYQVNFSSPESVFYIFLHLKQRLLENDLKPLDKLFDISSSSITTYFKDTTCLTKMESNNPLVQGHSVSHSFGAKTLKDFFEARCIEFLPDQSGKRYKYNSAQFSKGTVVKFSKRKVRILQLFMKGISKEDDYYEEFRSNHISLLMDYKEVLPHLIAKNYDSIQPKWKKILNYWNEHETGISMTHEGYLEKRIKESYADFEVSNIVNSYINSKFGTIEDMTELNIRQLMDFAYEDNSIGFFNESETYLDCLMMKGFLKDDIFSCIKEDIEILPFANEELVSNLVSTLSEAGIIEYYNLEVFKLELNANDYINSLKDDGTQQFLTRDAILEICFITMMGKVM